MHARYLLAILLAAVAGHSLALADDGRDAGDYRGALSICSQRPTRPACQRNSSWRRTFRVPEQTPVPTSGSVMRIVEGHVSLAGGDAAPEQQHGALRILLPDGAGQEAGRDRAAHSGRRLRPGAAVLPGPGQPRAWRRCF